MDNPTPRPLTVTLVSNTSNPLGTLYLVWEKSRTNDPLLKASTYENLAKAHTSHEGIHSLNIDSLVDIYEVKGIPSWESSRLEELAKTVYSTVEDLLTESVPVTENIQFVFEIDNMSISLREQMVRHRIGTTVGERMGLDIIPDLPQSTWWSQTTRVLPLDSIYDEGRYYIPDTVKNQETDVPTGDFNIMTGEKINYRAREMYEALIKQCQVTYNALVAAGVPREDARQVMPMAMTHGITWGINLKALIHIAGKRGCWVAQANLWEEMLRGMVNEIAKVSPLFRQIILPPCIKKGKYVGCVIPMVNVERVQGRDGMPPCPLFIRHQGSCEVVVNPEDAWQPPVGRNYSPDIMEWTPPNEIEADMLKRNAEKYDALWGIDLETLQPK